jgi:hypothetical protein
MAGERASGTGSAGFRAKYLPEIMVMWPVISTIGIQKISD